MDLRASPVGTNNIYADQLSMNRSPCTKPNIYASACLGRYGLAHSLIAFARMVVWANSHPEAGLLVPYFSRIRIGPYFRGESDKRKYAKCFCFDNYIAGLKRAVLLLCGVRISPATTLTSGRRSCGIRPQLVVFNNLHDKNDEVYFHEFAGHHTLVRDELVRVTRPEYRPQCSTEEFIAIHVRRGDFVGGKSDAEIVAGARNARLPIAWYCDTLQRLRSQLGGCVKALVFSDGAPDELRSLLALSCVKLVRDTAAITDLLAIAEAVALIGSGSCFSRFSSYLGQVPRISFPGQERFRVLQNTDAEIESTGRSMFPDTYVDAVRLRIGAYRVVGAVGY